LLRRDASDRNDVLRFADLVLCPVTHTVHRAGRPIELTPTEFQLLELFLRNPRRVLARS
jgi:DNA-binding response OmpR family regulator